MTSTRLLTEHEIWKLIADAEIVNLPKKSAIYEDIYILSVTLPDWIGSEGPIKAHGLCEILESLSTGLYASSETVDKAFSRIRKYASLNCPKIRYRSQFVWPIDSDGQRKRRHFAAECAKATANNGETS